MFFQFISYRSSALLTPRSCWRIMMCIMLMVIIIVIIIRIPTVSVNWVQLPRPVNNTGGMESPVLYHEVLYYCTNVISIKTASHVEHVCQWNSCRCFKLKAPQQQGGLWPAGVLLEWNICAGSVDFGINKGKVEGLVLSASEVNKGRSHFWKMYSIHTDMVKNQPGCPLRKKRF